MEQTLTITIKTKAATPDDLDRMQVEILAYIEDHYDLGFLDVDLGSTIQRGTPRFTWGH